MDSAPQLGRMDPSRGRGIPPDRRDLRQDSPRAMAMVSSSMGPINSLLNKLPPELEFMGLRHDLGAIRQHLLGFCAPGVVTRMLVRLWMSQLRELVYDIDGWIDALFIRSGGHFHPDKLSSDDSDKLQQFRDEIIVLQERGQQFGLLKVSFSDLVPSGVTIDLEGNPTWELIPEHWILFGKNPCIVGLNGPESEIVQHLIDDEPKLKTLCILGLAGLRKTTLAREVFRKEQSKFDCGAFVCFGRSPSIYGILMDIAHQVMPRSLIPSDEKLIATKLWEFLGTKRYLIVIDDVWTIPAWCSFRGVLPENHNGSRILATTEVKQVSSSCCTKRTDFVYLLQGLSDSDSKLLMLDHISTIQEDCLFGSKIIQRVLKTCGGNPLAVLVTAGFLAAKGAKQLESRAFDVLSMMSQNSMNQDMRRILDISYADLPLHLKSCFLYLSAFPENCTINKGRLIRRWIAEGFVPTRNGVSLWGTGESYFYELAQRSLIQLVFDETNDQSGCTVHSLIHEYIINLSTQDNFVTKGEQLSSGSYCCDPVRRFVFDCSKQIESGILALNTMHLSRVRSLVVSGNTNKQIPPISDFKLVQVLDLENATGLRRQQLRNIESLLLLRYLGLRGSDVTKLPQQMKALEQLQTIDLRQTNVKALPQLTRNLVSLLVDCGVIHREMDDMSKLEELSTILVGRSYSLQKAAKLIEKSKLLRVLGVRIEGYCEPRELMYFLSHLHRFNFLHTFSVEDFSCAFVDMLDFYGPSLSFLYRFELKISTPVKEIPVKLIELQCLTHLHISVCNVDAEGLHVLGGLPGLLFLHLDSHGSIQRCIISNRNRLRNCFNCLEVFGLRCLHGGMGLQFALGVMPRLQRFNLSFSAEMTRYSCGDFEFGIQNLESLQHISVTIQCSGSCTYDGKAAEAKIKDEVSQILNRPMLELKIKYLSSLD